MKSIVPSSYAISMCSDSKIDWCFACALPHALLLSSGDSLRQYRVGCGDATRFQIYEPLTTQSSVLAMEDHINVARTLVDHNFIHSAAHIFTHLVSLQHLRRIGAIGVALLVTRSGNLRSIVV